jgi:hypothetical protein
MIKLQFFNLRNYYFFDVLAILYCDIDKKKHVSCEESVIFTPHKMKSIRELQQNSKVYIRWNNTRL